MKVYQRIVLEYDTRSKFEITQAEDESVQIRQTRSPRLIGKDGTRWRKHPVIRRNIGTRAQNVYPRLPGPLDDIRHKRDINSYLYH